MTLDLSQAFIAKLTFEAVKFIMNQHPPIVEGELHGITWYCFPRGAR